MPQSSTPVIPFYESEGPPQALPLLTYHTEMLCPALSFRLDIFSKRDRILYSSTQGTHSYSFPHLATTSCGTTPIPPHAPTPKVVKLVSFTAEQFTPSSEASTYSSLSSIDSKDSKIPKTEGEVGCPGRGGYNLEMALNWDDDHFKNLKEYVHRYIKKHCDVSKSKKHQTPAALQEIHKDAVVESHPLNNLHPTATHTYPPALASIDHDDCHSSAEAHTYPPQPVIPSSEESPMETANPWQSVRRMRDDDKQRPNKVFLNEVDQSSKLREDVCELHFSNRDLLLRKRHVQISSNVHESDMQSVIIQYQEYNQSLQRDNADALTSLDQNHRQEVVELQNNMAKAQNEARTEIGQKEAQFQHEMHLAKDRFLADKEAELMRLNARYSSKIHLLNHLVGKKPVATCTNIIGFASIPDVSSESDADEEPQMTGNGPPLTSLLGDVLIAHATVGMLAEALVKVLQIPQTTSPRGPRSGCKPLKPPVENFTNNQRQDNKANIWELFKTAFHATKDEDDRNATGKDDQVVWAYLQSMMENLGKDGMSSDESEYGDGDVQVFRQKSMPWRADFSHEMQIIDQQRLTGAAIFTPHGSKPAKRFRNANQDSSHNAIEGLPTAFYDPTWLTEQRLSFMVSKKKFQRMEIIVARQ
ncbi:hypothetical protein DFH29DRAFT_1009302 [Suillus ampliporus]|nr:hypothetical protein DFH29DRAFT_1009302 [Suillus ampliporus]